MDLIVGLIAGGAVGWLASVLMRTDERPGAARDVIVGAVGAALAEVTVAPMIGAAGDEQGRFSLGALLVALLGAVILLAIVNLVRRVSAR